MYRLAHAHLSAPIYVKPITFIYLIFYKFFTEMIVGTEIHWRCKIGPGACVYHGYGLVINSETKIGSHVILRHGVTIGSKSAGIEQSPDIGDYVDVGAAAIILGQTKIGNRVIIGAGSVVLKDIPDDAVAAGNPCRVIRIRPAVEPSH
jgi:serine acetyltransferase